MDTKLFGLFWEGFAIETYSHSDSRTLILRLTAKSDYVPRCGSCGQQTSDVHDVSIRRVRERDLFHYRVWLEVPVRRVRCTTCGPRQEHVSWLAGRLRLTRSMVDWVETLVKLMPVQHVSKVLGLHWHTIKAIDHRRLLREVPEVDRRQVRRLVMDEFALYKGHRYATVVIDAETQQVLWVGEGRSRKAVRPFFEWLGPEACERIEAVAMDMNTAMDLEVQRHCPNAQVVYDLFHVVAKFGREVIDRVRVDQANQLRQDMPARLVIKRSRWLLLRNKENLKDGQQLKLDELLAVNQPLMTVYLLKDQLKDLWYAPSEAIAKQRWSDWLEMALVSGIKKGVKSAVGF